MTDIVVSRVQQPGTYWDETTPGFGVRVGKNRKTWIVMRGQIRQRVRIGHYPRMSLADARKEAKKLLFEEPTKNPAITFQGAYDEYKADVIEHKKPTTQVEYRRLLTKYFTPTIGRKRLAELAYEQIMECVKHASTSEAVHALAVCRAFLRWCIRPPRRYLKSSPLEGVPLVSSVIVISSVLRRLSISVCSVTTLGSVRRPRRGRRANSPQIPSAGTS